jgi:prevent-host-death family protein
MKTVTIHEAKTHLSRLIREVLTGEEIIIARGKEPLVKLTPLKYTVKEREFGCAEGMVEYIADDFDAPLDDFKDYVK